MDKGLLLVIPIGLAIGLMLPSEPAPAPHKVEAKAVAPAPNAKPEAPHETQLERKPNGHFYVDAEVNGGNLVNFLVDTGASSVALTMQDAERIGIGFSPSEFDIVGTGASGPVRGQFVTLNRVSIDGKEVREVRGAVIEGLEVSLLGQSYLSRIGGVEMSGNSMTLR